VQAEHIFDTRGKLRGMKGTIQDVTKQKKIEADLRHSQMKLRSLTAELEKAEERERRQIACDLHDSIGQILAFSARELSSLHKVLPDHFARSVREVTEQLDLAVKQTRTLSFDLSPSILYDFGLEEALEELLERFSAEKNIRCCYENDSADKPLAEHIKILLYRAVRELLINVSKHAQATEVKVALLRRDQQIQVLVEDNGRGLFIPDSQAGSNKTNGFGLFSISERLDHIGGTLEMESSPGKGVQVRLTAPLEQPLESAGT
jgi:signal transduction histidine kinase